MANPVWFNENDYLASKLAQLQKAGNTQFSTLVQVKSAIEAAGYSVFNHFQQFSLTEGTSPNAFFNADEYLAAKAAQLNALPGNTTAWTAQMVAVAIKNAGFTTVYEHFSTHGWLENVNPSNSFDVSAYFAAKLAALQAAEPSAGWTEQKVKDAFKAAGFDPISHYAAHGKNEAGVVVTPVPAGEQVAGGVAATFTLTTGTDYADTTTAFLSSGAVTSTFKFTSGNETVNSAGGTFATADILVDNTTTDNDVLNATLTVQAANAGSHQGRGWEQFTDAIIRAVNDRGDHVVFILWGSYAQKKGAFIDRTKHLVLEAPHPSPLSAHRGFLGCGHFIQANDYLKQHGKTPIDWTAVA